MSSETITCPSCGHESEDHQWCDNCGSPLEAPETNAEEPAQWLAPGDTFQLKCSLHELDIDPYHGEVLLEVKIDEIIETSSVRHISRASVVECLEFHCPEDEEFNEEMTRKLLLNARLTVEELSALLGDHQDDAPAELKHLIRVPAGDTTRGDHTVMVFGEDGSLTLEEYIMSRNGQLDYQEVKEIFSALLDLCEQLHSHNYLYLRLSPWTLRVVQQRDSSGEVVGEIGAEETFIEDEESEEANDHIGDTSVIEDLPEGFDELPKTSSPEEASETDSSEEDESNEHEEDEQASPPSDELPPIADDAPTLGQTSDFEIDADQSAREEPEERPVVAEVRGGTDPNFPALRETTQMAAVKLPKRGGISRALLDGGARFYRADQTYDELPVVMGFSPTEMFGRAQVPLAPGYDIFSMGMILYYLTSGALPPTSIYTRHTSAIPARHYRPDFPIGMQTVIGRATRADIQERFTDVATMREAFERACELIEARIALMQRAEVPRIKLAMERHIGISKRLRNPINQDNVFGATSADNSFSLIVVADGVSTASYGSGDMASKHIVDVAEQRWPAILTHYETGSEVDEFEIIYSLLDEANQRIVDYVNTHHLPFHGNPHEVMGTTTLIAVVHNGIVTLGSLGDSRAYLQRGTSFEQITIDHNLWTLSVLDGVPADNALSLPHSDALARCLGTFYVEHERLHAISPQPDIFRFPVISGDTLLMATDGLLDFAGASNTLSEDNTLSILLSEPNPALAALELILLANRGGGGDNIGIGLAKFF